MGPLPWSQGPAESYQDHLRTPFSNAPKPPLDPPPDPPEDLDEDDELSQEDLDKAEKALTSLGVTTPQGWELHLERPALVPRYPELLGSEVPRVYTPELRELTPETTWGYDVVWFLERVVGWDLYPWQRWLYLHALELDEQGNFRYDTVLLLVARQNGKTKWLLGLALWFVYRRQARLVVNTAQLLDYAEGLLSEADHVVTSNKNLRREKVRYYETNGKHRLVFSDRRTWRAAAANRKGGRSLSANLALLDELREHTNYDAWNALVPTTTAVPNSLAVAVSNAGDVTSVVLKTLLDKARQRVETKTTAKSKVFLAEYSAPELDEHGNEVSYTDQRFWPQANPSLGWGFPLSKLEGYLETSSEAGFKTEHLCRWVEVLEPGAFSWDDWREARDPDSKLPDEAQLSWCVDVSWDGKVTHVAVAGTREDGRLHVELVASRPKLSWVVTWFATRAQDPTHPFDGRVVLQGRGAPVSALAEKLEDAGLQVVRLQGADLSNAPVVFAELLEEGTLVHLDQPTLTDSVKAVKARNAGDATYLDRKNSPVDAAPAVAAVQAAYDATRVREVEETRESAYASHDFVVL